MAGIQKQFLKIAEYNLGYLINGERYLVSLRVFPFSEGCFQLSWTTEATNAMSIYTYIELVKAIFDDETIPVSVIHTASNMIPVLALGDEGLRIEKSVDNEISDYFEEVMKQIAIKS